MTDKAVQGFSDEDLKWLKESISTMSPNLYGRFPFHEIQRLLNRLEAAEQVCIDVGYPDHPSFLDEMPWRREHYNAWRKSKGE